MSRALAPVCVAVALCGLAGMADAQIDPEPRANLELGVEGPLRGNGPISGYGFLFWNRPHFLDDDWYLRVILAPTYLTSELVFDHTPARGHTIGVGVAGGVFPTTSTSSETEATSSTSRSGATASNPR